MIRRCRRRRASRRVGGRVLLPGGPHAPTPRSPRGILGFRDTGARLSNSYLCQRGEWHRLRTDNVFDGLRLSARHLRPWYARCFAFDEERRRGEDFLRAVHITTLSKPAGAGREHHHAGGGRLHLLHRAARVRTIHLDSRARGKQRSSPTVRVRQQTPREFREPVPAYSGS